MTEDEEWELETRAFHAANQEQTTEVYQQLIRDLWKAYCDAAELIPARSITEQLSFGS